MFCSNKLSSDGACWKSRGERCCFQISYAPTWHLQNCHSLSLDDSFMLKALNLAFCQLAKRNSPHSAEYLFFVYWFVHLIRLAGTQSNIQPYLLYSHYFILGLCVLTDRQPPAHMPLYPATCDVSAKALPPRLLAPPPVPKEPPTNTPKDEVRMELENASLWKQFSSVGTEMIITKKGR